MNDAFRRLKISKLCSSFFALLKCEAKKWEPLWLDVCALVFAAFRWVIPGAYFSVRKRLKRRGGPLQTLRKQKFSRITRCCVTPRPLERGSAPHSCDRNPRFFYVYVDNLGVLGTSREKMDSDLMKAVQTLKSRGLDTHEETVHSNTAITLAAQHVGECCSDSLVAFETRSPLGAALSSTSWEDLGGASRTHDVCVTPPTRRAQCAICPQQIHPREL